jgi:hypothetical protein
MENFEDEFSDLLARKRRIKRTGWRPNPKDSLEMLLKHVYRQALVPIHLALTEQQDFFSSTLELDVHLGADDVVGDGMKDRPMARLRVFRRSKLIFDYFLSFDGDTKTRDASLWRHVDFIDTFPKIDLANMPPNFFDEIFNDKPGFLDLTKKQKSVGDYLHFSSLDLDKVVQLVQEDLYTVCKTLL